MKKKRISRSKYQENIRKQKYKTKLKPWAFWIFLIIFVFMLIFIILELINWQLDNEEIQNIEKEIEENIKVEEVKEEGELVNPPVDDTDNDYWNYIKLPFYNVNFATLLEINPDTVGFIHIENTNINYPIVHTTNNTYYLSHAFDKSKNDAGWVFLDYRNSLNSLADNTVIYGHGRLNRTVFGSLKDTLTSEWQANKDNYVIRISTPTENMLFQIFSIYTIESESYYITTSFRSLEAKKTWLETMKERNTAPIDTAVTVDDKILTLSTCLNDYGGRIVVQAKLIKKQTK